MIEMRTIRPDEADTFLRVMCSVFQLEFGHARTTFYQEPYYDLETKWALFEHGRMVSILTLTPLLFGWGPATGVAGVATVADAQRLGYAGRLLNHVLGELKHKTGEATLLFATDERLYTRLGFETVDRVVTADLTSSDDWDAQEPMSSEEVKEIYDAWASADPNRLVRDERRWQLWNWNFRICARFQDGYLGSDPGLLREALSSGPKTALPVVPGTQWYGLTRVADAIQLPLENPTTGLFLMTRSTPGSPLMFMTDQF
jgi:GNAT superfamily N-acetyltransferase